MTTRLCLGYFFAATAPLWAFVVMVDHVTRWGDAAVRAALYAQEERDHEPRA